MLSFTTILKNHTKFSTKYQCNSTKYGKNYKPCPSGIYSRSAQLFRHPKINYSANHHIKGINNKNHNHFNKHRKAFDQTQQPSFMIKTFNKLWIEVNFFDLIKDICKKPTHLMEKDWCFPSNVTSPQCCAEILSRAIRGKRYPYWKGEVKTTFICKWHNLVYRKV